MEAMEGVSRQGPGLKKLNKYIMQGLPRNFERR